MPTLLIAVVIIFAGGLLTSLLICYYFCRVDDKPFLRTYFKDASFRDTAVPLSCYAGWACVLSYMIVGDLLLFLAGMAALVIICFIFLTILALGT